MEERPERRGEAIAFLLPLDGRTVRLSGESLGVEEEEEEGVEEGVEEEVEEVEEEEGVGEESSLWTTTEIFGILSEVVVGEEEGADMSSEEPLPLLLAEREEEGGVAASASSSPSRGALVLRLRSVPNFTLSSSNFLVAAFFGPVAPAEVSLSFCAVFCVCACSFCLRKRIRKRIKMERERERERGNKPVYLFVLSSPPPRVPSCSYSQRSPLTNETFEES